MEEAAKGKSKTMITTLEAKIAGLEEKINIESTEKQRVSREFKRNEKRINELLGQIEDEKKKIEGFKDQVAERCFAKKMIINIFFK